MFGTPYLGSSYDSLFFIGFIAIMGLGLYAQVRLQSTFRKYSQIHLMSQKTAAQIAREILQAHGIQDVIVEATPGSLTDHYDPKSKVVRLSSTVYGSTSIASIGVAAHEVGHAIQHHENYAPIKWRDAIYPVMSLGSRAWIYLLIFGIFAGYSTTWIYLAIAIFAVSTLFYLVTLPLEFDASHRALILLSNGYFNHEEYDGAKKVLSAAALTYIVAFLSALLQLLRFISLLNRRD